MTIDDLITTLTTAENTLKQTTLGYKQKSPTYWTNPTTNWFKGLTGIETVVAQLRKLKIVMVLTTSTKPVVGEVITATIVIQ